jgi:MFS family permease
MGVYFASYFIGTFTGPIIAGNMAEYIGWRSFFWLCTGVSVLNLMSLLLIFPETKFHRPSISQSSHESKVCNKETTHVEVSEPLGAMLGKGKPSRRQWLLAQRPFPGVVNSLARDFVTPIYILSFPIVFWAVIVVGGAANLLLVMNLTQSPVFSSPPHNFSPGNVGFVNFAFIVGGLIAMATSGVFSDWVAKTLTKRNNDIREPEMRMLAIIPYFLIMIIGCIVVALGYQRGWPWQAIVLVGYTCIGIQVVSLPTIAVAYAVDSYKPISGEILVICTVFKNTFGFGMSWWVPDLTPEQSVLVLFACNTAACLVGIPVYFWGKQLRRWTWNSKVHGMENIM